MRYRRLLFCAGVVAAVLIVGATVPGFVSGTSGRQSTTSSVAPLEQYIEIELSRVEEAYALVERLGPQVWPGWTNYLEPEFYVNFPNGLRLLLGSPDHAPEGFERVAGRTVHGKAVYLNRKNELPTKLTELASTGGNGGLSVEIYLQQWPNRADYRPDDGGVSETSILLEVHELFHCLQHQHPAFVKIEEAEEKGGSVAFGTFTVDLNYAKWSSVEGRSLLGAYDAKDVNSVREYLEDYLVARREKQKSMPPAIIAVEQARQNPEGTAVYATLKMAMVIRDSEYTGSSNHAGDALFFKFAHMDGYLKQNLREQTKYSMDNTMDTLGKYYQYGALECFALDRLAPDWKGTFLESGKTLDNVAAEVLKLEPADEERIKERLSTKYNMTEIEAKHRPAIEERDQALALIAQRKGRRYIVDFSKLPKNDVIGVTPDYSKKHVQLGVHMIFPQGAGIVRLGEVEISTADTPIEKFLRTIEWIDPDSQPGEPGYESTFSGRDGDVLKGVVVKTRGFTLKAPEAQITADKEKNEVRILILSKVKR
jgi:hypothetical protein